MSVEWFSKLKEIDSLSKMKAIHLKALSEEKERIAKLNHRLKEAQEQKDSLKQELIKVNDQMELIEKNLKTASQQKERLLDMGGDEAKINHFTTEINNYEEQGMVLLEKLDEVNSQLQDNKSFIAGVGKTIEEIQNEIKPIIEKNQQEISNIDFRTNLLREELPPEFKSILDKTVAKNLAHGPFTRIEQGSCYFCRYKISRVEESEIDMQKSLKLCPQCSRIFLPYGA